MRFSELSMVMSPDTLYRARSSIPPLLFIDRIFYGPLKNAEVFWSWFVVG